MNDKPTASLTEHFASLEDPRIDRTKLHQLFAIIVIAICAIIFFGRVFGRLNAEQFQKCFLVWIQAVSEVTHGQVIALDGKVLRSSCQRPLGQAGIAMVSAWATANHLVLGQVQVDDKSNKITTTPKLPQTPKITGCIVTIDTMSCHLEIAQAIVARDAD